MRRFIAEQNIRHFKRVLESETDLSQRAIVRDLLAQAEQELAEAKREFAEQEKAARSSGDALFPGAAAPCRRTASGGSK